MIIDSLLDTDLYKFTMMQCVLHQFPAAQAEYKFKCRNPGTDLQAVIGPINEEIDHLCALHFRKDELDYLRSLRFMKRRLHRLFGTLPSQALLYPGQEGGRQRYRY